MTMNDKNDCYEEHRRKYTDILKNNHNTRPNGARETLYDSQRLA